VFVYLLEITPRVFVPQTENWHLRMGP